MRTLTCILFAAITHCVVAQNEPITLAQAIKTASENNPGLKASSLEVESQRQLKKTGFDLPKANLSLLYGQYNSYRNDNNFTITQSIPFTALGSQASLNKALVASAQLKKAANENELIFQVKQVYYTLAFEKARGQLLAQQDSIFQGFLKSATLRHKTGEANLLEQATAETQRSEVSNQLKLNEASIIMLRSQLKMLMNIAQLPEIVDVTLAEKEFDFADSSVVDQNPLLAFMRQEVDVAGSRKKLENARFAPDLLLGYFNQTLLDVPNLETGSLATASDRFSGFQIGVSLPLWFVPHQGRAKAAEYSRQAAESSFQNEKLRLESQFQQAAQQYEKAKGSLNYYKNSALPNANIILNQVQVALRNGEIGYAEYLLGVRNAINIKESFLMTLNEYNQAIIYIEFLSGNK